MITSIMKKDEFDQIIKFLIDKDELVLPMLKPGGTFDRLILDREDKA